MRRHRERGAALLSAVLILMLMSALLVGFVAVIQTDQRTGFVNRDQTTAYAAAHAGLEQLTADLGQLFATNYRPTSAQVNALMTNTPAMPGVTFEAPGGGPGYLIQFNDVAPADGFPDAEPQPRTITSGPYQGLMGTVTPYSIEVTARTDSGAEVRMRRTMQTVLIPAFQFGIYSDNDLSFFAGPTFDFGGRVHTNANLFLAEGNGQTLWLRDRVTAVGEVVRTNLSNGWPTSSNYTGTVRIIRFPGDTTLRPMAMNEGSWAATPPQLPPPPQTGVIPPPGSNEPTWTNVSVTQYNKNIMNARTGARPLVLPLVQMGAQPIDLIRRPVVNSNEDTTNAAVFGQRYYARATLRILLSDTAADLTGLPGVTPTPPINLADLRPTSIGGNPPPWYPLPDPNNEPVASAGPHPIRWWRSSSNSYVNFGVTGSPPTPPSQNNYYATTGVYQRQNEPIVTGWIKIELQRNDFTWVDVTQEILSLGFTGRRLSTTSPGTSGAGTANAYYLNDTVFNNVSGGVNCADPSPDAVIRIQRVRDDHNPAYPCGIGSPNAFDYWPNVLFDPREGNLRDSNPSSTTTVSLAGVMHYVELDVRNLVRWLAGTIGSGAFGPNGEASDGGYVVYFSDRRTNQRLIVGGNAIETGEYGFEDFVNPNDQPNGAPNGVLDPGEDVNGIDADGDGSNLDTYGMIPILPANLRSGAPISGATRPWTQVSARQARSNPALVFRRALKIVNAAGPTGSVLTALPPGTGLTIVSENPVYVQGNYNTSTAGNFGNTQNDHRPSAIIADAVTLLSNNWNDIRSFIGPQNKSSRPGNTSWYRTAIVSGKGLSFNRPSWAPQDFGTDGGAHNFLRFIESWTGQTLNYRGSIVSFYTSRQGVGTYKCCTNVYDPPSRGYRFDTEFLQLSLLPPKSPAFRDVNTLTFRQILRPTQ